MRWPGKSLRSYADGIAYNTIMKTDIEHVKVSEQVNEADNVYYLHCYHDTVRSYDAYNHLVGTDTQQYQAVGG